MGKDNLIFDEYRKWDGTKEKRKSVKPMNIRIDQSHHDTLAKIAKIRSERGEEGVTSSSIIRELVINYINSFIQ